jgi:glycosyltransferase involved in cell wall biosynthesis
VSIITPSYNSEKFIKDTIGSVLSQTYKNWEMIIVDDVSPDNSNEIIEEYCKKDSRIKLIKLAKNSGPAVARNRAIQEAKGRYIAFLDADDLWKSEKLEKQIKFMTDNDLAFTYSSYDLLDEYRELSLKRVQDFSLNNIIKIWDRYLENIKKDINK